MLITCAPPPHSRVPHNTKQRRVRRRSLPQGQSIPDINASRVATPANGTISSPSQDNTALFQPFPPLPNPHSSTHFKMTQQKTKKRNTANSPKNYPPPHPARVINDLPATTHATLNLKPRTPYPTPHRKPSPGDRDSKTRSRIEGRGRRKTRPSPGHCSPARPSPRTPQERETPRTART